MNNINPLQAPITPAEIEASATVSKIPAKTAWTPDQLRDYWDAARTATAKDVLLNLYLVDERGLDLSLIDGDQVRVAHHRSNPDANEYPALLFPGTDASGKVERFQAVRFDRSKLLKEPGPQQAVKLSEGGKITNGTGSAPFRANAVSGSDAILHICEGPEDALTIRQVTGCETWASFSLNAIGKMPVTAGRTVIVHTDRGSEGETRRQAQHLADAGACVSIAPPPEGYKDANEALCAGKADAITDAIAKAEALTGDLDQLPTGYARKADGWIVDGTGETEVRICHGLQVLGVARDTQSKGWGKLVEVTTREGTTHRAVIPMGDLVADGIEVRKVLAELGVRIGHQKGLITLLNAWEPRGYVMTVQKAGWTDATCKTFILGNDRVIGEQTAEPVHLDGMTHGGVADEIRAGGSFEDWKCCVAAKCVGNPVLILSVSAAFVSPLLEPLNAESGGIHLVGASSTGKSTALRAYNSVWGAYPLVGSWRTTDNGLEGRAKACNGSGLTLDEMGEADPRDVEKIAYMLGNGQGKSRASQTGEARNVAMWKLCYLSSGEIGLSDKLAEADKRAKAGQLVRLLDIQATDRTYGAFDHLHGFTRPSGFADAITTACATDYGHAGPAFVQALIDGGPDALEAIKAARDAFKAEVLTSLGDVEGQVSRAVGRFALIAAAGEQAAAWGLLPWAKGAASAAAREMFALWLKGRGGTASGETTEAIKSVRSFISQHGDRFNNLVPPNDGLNPADSWALGYHDVRDQVGWFQPAHDGQEAIYWISKDGFAEIVKGQSPKRAVAALRNAGLLICDGDGRVQTQTPRCITTPKRAYAVRGIILDADDTGKIDV